MTTIAPRPQPGILDIQAYVGGESRIPGIDRPARLASNENPLGPSPLAMRAYEQAMGELHRYPDGGATELRAAIGRVHGLDAAQIVCGAGSDELFALIAMAYAGVGDEVLYTEHGFLAYPICARSVGATPVSVPETGLRTDVDALLAAVGPKTRIIFVANPNNPTGSYLPTGEIARLVDGVPADVLLVLDAAYAEYVDRSDYSAGHEFVRSRQNVVVTHTFSKIFGLGGIRLGWAYCPLGVAEVLNRVRQPFNVNAPALAAGLAALSDVEFLAKSRAHNDRWLPWLCERVTALGFTAYPSVGNFLLVSMKPHNAEEVRLFLKSQGVLVRQMGSYGLPDCLRMTIGTAAELAQLASALEAFIGCNDQAGA